MPTTYNPESPAFLTTFVTDDRVVYSDISAYLESLDLFLQCEQDEVLAELALNPDILEDVR